MTEDIIVVSFIFFIFALVLSVRFYQLRKVDSKKNNFFSFFWLASGIIWFVAAIRNMTAKDDFVGLLIYISVSFLSFVLFFAYRRNFLK